MFFKVIQYEKQQEQFVSFYHNLLCLLQELFGAINKLYPFGKYGQLFYNNCIAISILWL